MLMQNEITPANTTQSRGRLQQALRIGGLLRQQQAFAGSQASSPMESAQLAIGFSLSLALLGLSRIYQAS